MLYNTHEYLDVVKAAIQEGGYPHLVNQFRIDLTGQIICTLMHGSQEENNMLVKAMRFGHMAAGHHTELRTDCECGGTCYWFTCEECKLE